ncbi:MAG: L-rhamnose/proton symporter RhaT [Bacteroidota bacterium]|nr:L-rhamnose/proton symporter RhaT [Bacteroidota bacterium]MDP4204720.1 L-rhamnose/proton symporter RhaT [Bacteroidota bacterium]
MNPIYGIALISLGSICAASFYVPIKKVKNWSWESFWTIQGIFAWLVAPWLFAFLTVPSGTLLSILSEAPTESKLWATFFGVLWGVGGLTFGLSIRYLGVSLGQSIALGFCAAFGTLIPPIVNGENLFSTPQGILMVVGVSVCIVGIAIIGYAGSLKSKNMTEEEKRAAVKDFALKKGLIIAVLAGVMSACMSFGIAAGKGIEDVALAHNTDPLFKTNPSYIFILLGGFFTNFVYCFYLNIKNKTIKDYLSVSKGVFASNLFFCALTGTLWFMQFFFFGMGKSKMPVSMVAFSWSILMALNIAFSNIWGVLLKEWKGAGAKTMIILLIGILTLIFSTFVVNF